MVAPRVYQAMAQPVVGHLDPFFFQVVEEVRSLLGYAYSTKNQFNVALSGTGSAGMEAAVANFIEPGEKFALLTNGFFGDRIGDMARRHGGDVVRLCKPWGEPFDPQEAREFIRRERPRVVAFVQAETSTGLYNQGQAICEAAHEVDALTIADCVTSLGGMPVLVDETGIDIAYSCSQKGLGCPPGLSPVTVSPRALDRLKTRKTPVQSFYLDLQVLDTFYTGHKYHHTASATMFYALREGLAIVAEEGLEARWERHRVNHEAFVAGIEAMGLSMHVPAVTVFGRSIRRAFRRAWTTPRSASSCWRSTAWRSPAVSDRWPARSSASARWATVRRPRTSNSFCKRSTTRFITLDGGFVVEGLWKPERVTSDAETRSRGVRTREEARHRTSAETAEGVVDLRTEQVGFRGEDQRAVSPLNRYHGIHADS